MSTPQILSHRNSFVGVDSKRITLNNLNMTSHTSNGAGERKQQIQVFVRLRPFLKSEPHEQTIQIDSEESKVIIQDTMQQTESTFDYAFDQTMSQKQVFDEFKPYMNDILDGYNLTIFAYGQTGSGKTHTMFGADWEFMHAGQQQQQQQQQQMQQQQQQTSQLLQIPSQSSILLPSLTSPKASGNQMLLQQSTFFESIESDMNYAGIIPRTIYELFHQIAMKREQNPNIQISVYVSFIQIYNEKIFDLLQDTAKPVPLQIHEDKDHGTYVEGLAEYQVAHYYDSLQLMKRGEKNRAIRTTSMNTKSSRSHTIFQMQIESIDDGEYAKEKKIIKRSKINLCDLAGSEKINKNEIMGGAHFNELRSINLSLTTLGKVIHSLSSTQKLPVPYRESKLTRILQDSLQGNCQTFIVANISPCQGSIDETISTLKFAERAQHITLKVKPNEINASDIQIIQKLQREINYLKELLNMKKKGINTFDVHSRLLKLQEENDRLKKTHISINEVERIIQENRKMKMEMEMSKIQTPNGLAAGGGQGFFAAVPRTETFLRQTGGANSFSYKSSTDPEIMYPRSEHNIDRPDANSTNFNSIKSHNQSLQVSVGNSYEKLNNMFSPSTMSAKRITQNNNSSNTFITSGRLMLKQAEPATELPMRIRGKHNDFKIEKGFLEVSNADQQRAEKKKKEKLKILERLGNLDKINQRNQDVLNLQLQSLNQSVEREKPLDILDRSREFDMKPPTTQIRQPFKGGGSKANLNNLLNHKTQQSSPKNPGGRINLLNNSVSTKSLNTSENYELKIKRLEKKFLSKF